MHGYQQKEKRISESDWDKNIYYVLYCSAKIYVLYCSAKYMFSSNYLLRHYNMIFLHLLLYFTAVGIFDRFQDPFTVLINMYRYTNLFQHWGSWKKRMSQGSCYVVIPARLENSV